MFYNLEAPLTLVSALPYLCHFRPEETLAVVGIHESGTGIGAAVVPLDHEDLLERVRDALIGFGDLAEHVSICIFTEHHEEHHIDVLIADLLDLVSEEELAIGEVIVAHAGGWRSALCRESTCCAGPGNRFADQPGDRHPEVHTLDVPPELRMHWRKVSWRQWLDAIPHAAQGCLPDPERLVQLEMSLQDIPLRDALLAHLARASVTERQGLHQLLRGITAHVLVGLAPEAWTCLAAAEYLSGSYQQAGEIVDRVLQVREYSLATLLRSGLIAKAPKELLHESFSAFDPSALLAA